MIQANKIKIGNAINEYGEETTVYSIDRGGITFFKINDIAINKETLTALNGGDYRFTPIPITLDTLARCNSTQMNQIAPFLEIRHAGQDEYPKQLTLTVKNTGRKINSIHELQNFYEANTGDDLIYL